MFSYFLVLLWTLYSVVKVPVNLFLVGQILCFILNVHWSPEGGKRVRCEYSLPVFSKLSVSFLHPIGFFFGKGISLGWSLWIPGGCTWRTHLRLRWRNRRWWSCVLFEEFFNFGIWTCSDVAKVLSFLSMTAFLEMFLPTNIYCTLQFVCVCTVLAQRKIALVKLPGATITLIASRESRNFYCKILELYRAMMFARSGIEYSQWLMKCPSINTTCAKSTLTIPSQNAAVNSTNSPSDIPKPMIISLHSWCCQNLSLRMIFQLRNCWWTSRCN